MVVYLLIIEDVKGRSTFIHGAYLDEAKANEACKRMLDNDETYGDDAYVQAMAITE